MSEQSEGVAIPRGRGYSDTYEDDGLPGLAVHDLEHTMVVVVRGFEDDTYAALRAALRPDILLINLGGEETLDALDRDAMRAAGWVRADESESL